MLICPEFYILSLVPELDFFFWLKLLVEEFLGNLYLDADYWDLLDDG